MSDCGVLQRVLTELATKARHARQQWVIIRRGVTAALISCYMAGAKWNCCPRQSGRRVRYTTMIQPCTHTPSFAFRHLPPPNPTAACPDQYRPLSLEIACSVTFEPDEFVLKTINSASTKSCDYLIPFPHASLWKPWHPLADHHRANIINTSVPATATGVPRNLKTAGVTARSYLC